MKTITLSEFLDDATLRREVKSTLERGGLVCLPVNGSYRIIADLHDTRAVIHLFQSKRRVRKAPALVFVGNEAMLHQLADDLDPMLSHLAESMWPGPLTLMVPTGKTLPRKIAKQISGGKDNRVGVRVPDSEWLRQLICELGRPVLVSSANRERKGGETSPAQIRKNFARELDVFIDAGELTREDSSTVVEVDKGQVKIVRAGAISADFVEEAVAAAAE